MILSIFKYTSQGKWDHFMLCFEMLCEEWYYETAIRTRQ